MLSTAVNTVIDQILGTLDAVSPFAKAVNAAAVQLVGALVNWLIAGSFNAVSITLAVGAVVVSVIVYFTSNKTPAPAPAVTAVKPHV